MRLTDFLLARIAEDEAVAQSLVARDVFAPTEGPDMARIHEDDEYAALGVGAGRVLAECEAKRRVVDELDLRACGPCARGERCVNHDASAGTPSERLFDLTSERIMFALAAVYADHPDYRDEWR